MDRISRQIVFAAYTVLVISVYTSISASALSFLLLLIAFFRCWFLQGNHFFKIPISNSLIALFCFFCICLASILVNLPEMVLPWKSFFSLKYVFMGGISYFLLVQFIPTLSEREKKLLLILFMASATLASVSGLIGLATGFNPVKMKVVRETTRNCGLYGQSITYANGIQLFLNLIIGLAVFRKQLLPKNTIPSWFLFLVVLINSIGLFAAYSRGATIALFLSIPMLFIRHVNKRLFLVSLVLVISSFAVFLATDSTLKHRLVDQRWRSNEIRIAQYKAAILAFSERPLLGVGYRNFEFQSVNIKKQHGLGFAKYQGHAHSNLFEALASTGLFGLCSFLAFFLFWFRETWKLPSFWGDQLVSFTFATFFAGLTQYTFGDGENMFVIMTVYSISQAKHTLSLNAHAKIDAKSLANCS